MEKINDRTARYGISHFGDNFDDWDFGMDLDFTWAGILRSLLELFLKKLKLFPQPVRKGSAVAEQW